MDEALYLRLVSEAYKKIDAAFEKVDPDEAESYVNGDVLTITCKNGVRCVLNMQRATRQLWVAARASAWHFAWDEATGRWLDDKGRGVELFQCVRDVVRENAGVAVPL